MTGQEIKDRAENGILDGETFNDTDFFLSLLNIAKTTLEGSRPWVWLRKKNSGNTTSSSDTYETEKTLATDVRVVRSLWVNGKKYIPIDIENLEQFKNEIGYYWVNYVSGKFGLTGTHDSGLAIIYWYTKRTDDITLTTSWTFPTDYHLILSFITAGYYQVGVDADDIYARMSPENKRQALIVEQSLITWDGELLGNMNNDATPPQTRSDCEFMR